MQPEDPLDRSKIDYLIYLRADSFLWVTFVLSIVAFESLDGDACGGKANVFNFY
ncbi:hypothetical protein KBT16_05070 [Nostoc sp. CCCryo 231-06]|nr:hypothetical protein [Nostoc sp. CCCryo 231-06]